jgi:serine protease Do
MLAALALVMATGVSLAPRLWSADPAPVMTPEAREALDDLKNISDGFAAIAEAIIPSVVTVTSERVMQPADNPNPFFSDPFFRRFFGDMPQNRAPQRAHGLGSGVIVSSDGKILTNNHVIRGADELEVHLSDGRRLPAKVVGTDPRTDLAVLRVEAQDLPAVRFGDSDALRIGEWVMAVGSPFSENLRQTVSAGIVSGLGRSGMNLNDYEDFIQTDAAINPGNSGGALVNLDGELIGINSAIATRSGTFSGVGFAIPANLANEVMQDLITEGKVTRGWLGVQIQDVDETLAEAMELPASEGVLVNSVVDGGPADDAGLTRGDVIVEFAGKKVRSVAELRMIVARDDPGSREDVVIIRDGKRLSREVRLGTYPEEDEAAAEDGGGTHREELGITVEPITPELARRLEIENQEGLVVTAVSPGSPADEEGIRAGDVIRQVNRREVTTIKEMRAAVDDSGSDKPVLLLLERGGNTFFVALRAEG